MPSSRANGMKFATKRCHAALAAAAVALFSVGSAVAQTNDFLHSASLTDGVIVLFRAMDFAIFDDRWPTKGRTMKWSNEQTGNAGTVSIVDLFEHEGRPCRRIEHRIVRRGYADPVVFQLARCLSRDGATWEPF